MKQFYILLFLLNFYGCASVPLSQYPFCLEDCDCREGEICVRQLCQRDISNDGFDSEEEYGATNQAKEKPVQEDMH